MCKIEKILKTQRTSIPIGAQLGTKPMSMNQIRYNTDVIFSVAKKLEIPLDEAIDRMKRNGGMKTLNNAYRKRNQVSHSSVVKNITSEISGV